VRGIEKQLQEMQSLSENAASRRDSEVVGDRKRFSQMVSLSSYMIAAHKHTYNARSYSKSIVFTPSASSDRAVVAAFAKAAVDDEKASHGHRAGVQESCLGKQSTILAERDESTHFMKQLRQFFGSISVNSAVRHT
jgi:hypothetical protein